jgi:hypothetical protein
LKVSASETMPPPTVITAASWWATMLLQAAALEAAEAGLAVEHEDLVEGHAGLGSMAPLSSTKGMPSSARRARDPERGLAGAAQADQGDALAARGVFAAEVAHQAQHGLFHAAGESCSRKRAIRRYSVEPCCGSSSSSSEKPSAWADVAQDHDRRIGLAALDLGQVALGDVGVQASALRDMPRRARPSRTRCPVPLMNSASAASSWRVGAAGGLSLVVVSIGAYLAEGSVTVQAL